MATTTLKDLRFDYFRATILSIQPVSRIHIEWDLKRTKQDLTPLKFFIDRGECPEDMKQISKPEGISCDELREFVDYSGMMLDLHKVYYYRIRAVEFNAGVAVQTFETDLFTWDSQQDLIGLYVIEEHLFLYEHVNGVPVMIFKKKQEGARCPHCWDEVLGRVCRSNCAVCLGTGRMDGYCSPIEGWMLLEPDPKLADVADFGKRQPNQTDFQFTNYPELRVDDLIIELQHMKIWKVSNVRYPEKNRSIILQVGRVDAVNRTDIEYKIVVPEDRRLALVRELEERKLVPEF
jgi:hypothetical protein